MQVFFEDMIRFAEERGTVLSKMIMEDGWAAMTNTAKHGLIDTLSSTTSTFASILDILQLRTRFLVESWHRGHPTPAVSRRFCKQSTNRRI